MTPSAFTPYLILAALAAIGGLSAPRAHAGSEITNAAGTCQGALPQFAGTLRARPLALANEGGSTAFVTCSINGGGSTPSTKRIYEVLVRVRNLGSATATVNCTLVDGYNEDGDYVGRSAALVTGATADFLWTPAQLPGTTTYFKLPNLSCSLPPGAAIYWISHAFTPPTS